MFSDKLTSQRGRGGGYLTKSSKLVMGSVPSSPSSESSKIIQSTAVAPGCFSDLKSKVLLLIPHISDTGLEGTNLEAPRSPLPENKLSQYREELLKPSYKDG